MQAQVHKPKVRTGISSSSCRHMMNLFPDYTLTLEYEGMNTGMISQCTSFITFTTAISSLVR
jgi:hypothetical protein